ncbi:MAG TPA: efflux RND transporter periplasmic adaptor subunit [Vicinamibacterales bacterium]
MKTLAIVLVAVALAACDKAPPPAPPPPPEVTVGRVVQQDVPIYQELVGQTTGTQDVEIRARVEGYLQRVAFREGTIVNKGDLLYVIDPAPFEATIAGAKADLATAQARLDKTNNDVTRYTPLAKIQAVSQQELDNAVAAQAAATAMVDAGKASLQKATLDLSYTRVLAPVGGLIGTTKVKEGALVGRGENTLLTTISTIDPIKFRAGVAEAEYLRIRQQLEKTAGSSNLKEVPVELMLADGTTYSETGHPEFAERNVDAATGTLMIQFTFPNPSGLLRTGQYGRARFVLEKRTAAMLVPQRAVQEVQGQYSVATVSGDDAVTFHNVKVGPKTASSWVIEEGVKPGDRVIVEGLQRVKDGSKVTPREEPKPASAAGTK